MRKSRKVDTSLYQVSLKEGIKAITDNDGILVCKNGKVFFFECAPATDAGYLSVWAFNKSTKRWEYLWKE